MAFNCRAFGYRGTAQIPQVNAKQFSSDAVFMLIEPYEWAQVLVCDGATPPAFATQGSDQSTILRIEVPDGQTIRYEIKPPGRAVAAGAQSPSMSGKDQFYWGKGWSLSIVDAANFP